MGIDLEKQQSPVAKGDASAEPNKGAALPKRQDDTQKKGTGKILEEKHSPSDKVDHKYDLLGKILGWIGMGMVLYSIFFLGFFFCKRDCGPAALIVMVIGVLLMGLPLLMESGKSDGEGNVDFDFDFDCDGGGDGD